MSFLPKDAHSEGGKGQELAPYAPREDRWWLKTGHPQEPPIFFQNNLLIKSNKIPKRALFNLSKPKIKDPPSGKRSKTSLILPECLVVYPIFFVKDCAAVVLVVRPLLVDSFQAATFEGRNEVRLVVLEVDLLKSQKNLGEMKSMNFNHGNIIEEK